MSDRLWQHRDGKHVPEAAGEFEVARWLGLRGGIFGAAGALSFALLNTVLPHGWKVLGPLIGLPMVAIGGYYQVRYQRHAWRAWRIDRSIRRGLDDDRG